MEANETVKKVVATIALLESLDEENLKTKRGKTRKWIKRREAKGFFDSIVKELRIEETASYKEMLQMNDSLFDEHITPIHHTIIIIIIIIVSSFSLLFNLYTYLFQHICLSRLTVPFCYRQETVLLSTRGYMKTKTIETCERF